ncbi:MAG: hypothetical protein MUE60_02530 [Candidatus Eisenbacteria bacterium]|nr:hypothetical protein [Candidatus Eisenbacteria bacterium]
MRRIISLLLLSLLWTVATAQTPEPVVSLREKMLSPAAYRALAQQWKDYMERHGESAEGYVNLAQAYRYAGEAKDTYLPFYAKAVELGPTYARALDLYACQLWTHGNAADVARATEMFERARTADPTYGDVLYSLYGLHTCTGRVGRAYETAREMYERQLIHTPVWDFGYNILAGLPEGAVLVTNGDNDTYPLVSLQAGRGFRTDVTVLNQSLLGCPAYANAMREQHPDWFPEISKDVEKGPFSGALAVIRDLVKTRRRPVYISLTVPFDRLGSARSLTIEGLCARVDGLTGSSERTDYKKTLALFRDTYRLDSATDWTYPWDLRTAEQKLLTNYLHVLARAAEDAREAGDGESAGRLAEIGISIAKFHGETSIQQHLEELAAR